MAYEKILTESLYSLDKLTVEFAMKTSDMQQLIERLSNKVNVSQWVSYKMAVCRYNFSIEISEEFNNGFETQIKQTKDSFWIGIEPNWKAFEKDIKYGRIEFNPSKVGHYLEFIAVYEFIRNNVARGCLNPIKYDIAIDIPLARDKVYLIKDNRTYEEYANSSSDKTQYLGKRNTHGRIKLYNKALELKLEGFDLTRLECTMDFKNRSCEELERLIPKLYLLDNLQIPMDIQGTDKVLLIACMGDMNLLKELGRKKREKIESYLQDMILPFKVDSEKYNCVLSEIEKYRK